MEDNESKILFIRVEVQRKALTYFLEYLFLIQDYNLFKKFKEIKENTEGVVNMGIDEIREKYLEEKGKKESLRNSKILARCFRYRNHSVKNRVINR